MSNIYVDFKFISCLDCAFELGAAADCMTYLGLLKAVKPDTDICPLIELLGKFKLNSTGGLEGPLIDQWPNWQRTTLLIKTAIDAMIHLALALDLPVSITIDT